MLRVLGVTAPHYVLKNENIKINSLDSNDPFSLYNTFKICANKAEQGDESWGNSNWATKEERDNSIMLLQYFYNDAPKFLEKLKEINPNIIFIGSMTLGFKGAIEIAKLAKKALGDNVFIVLGGKHVNETIYYENGSIKQLKSSPIELMKYNKIPKVFDMVCSGDGEEITYEIGKALNNALDNNKGTNGVYEYDKFINAKGNWIIGWIDENNNERFIQSNEKSLNYDEMPNTNELFNISTKFDVFNDADLTAHTMSYLSKGCVHNCFYCSERNRINGPLKQTQTAPKRLFKNLKAIEKVGKSKYNSTKMSAFVEDSILLSGNSKLLNELSVLLEKEPLGISFGGQFTIDTLLDEENQKVISKLSKQGLEYVFIGLETNNENIAETMNKNKRKEGISWIKRNELAIKYLKENNIKYRDICIIRLRRKSRR